ncbi:MAG TPA: DNA-formamidopyrimidine glycosylase family protein [Mycobacteriales bacterium]|nr:DNA-formamidopyrimidine glycosylase family protein [Mycobacteriales bacterium]
MPEGDTVWRAARTLRAALQDEVLLVGELRVPQLGGYDLAGRTVLDVVPRGKHLLMRFDDHRTLHTHLRMDGGWRVLDAGRAWPRGDGPRHQVRIVLANARKQALGYRVHDVALAPTSREGQWVGHLGPDVLGPDWDAARAVANLLAQPDRPIGVALLDQRNLAGPGNIYRTEALFLHGTSPFTPVRDVPEPERLVERTRALMLANLENPVQQTTGDSRPGEQHYVFRREGRPCRRCGTRVREVMFGDPGTERVTAWCPHCQRGPQPDDATYRARRAAMLPPPDKLRKGPRKVR